MAAARADWYFDFISPFAYLQLTQFERLPADLEIRYRPVLFAGLLGHWGHKGPAEIPEKRRQTYRFCHWYAERHGIPFRFPPAHPFNPLRPLRLALALGCEPEVVRTLFAAIWSSGLDLGDDAAWREVSERLGVADADARLAAPEVKDALRQATEAAIARGVYGVPTFAVDSRLFWGVDSTEMFADYLADPERFGSGEYARIDALPVGRHRTG